jgi:hypothetical protein
VGVAPFVKSSALEYAALELYNLQHKSGTKGSVICAIV